MASSITKHCDKRRTLERQELGVWGKELEKANLQSTPHAHPTQDQAVSRSYSHPR
ncbi:MAG: hypothetical protein OIF58_10560 [Cohaesibacter sp.]|nr:hypothetical protein [Cohaesibacter sp.]